MSSSDERLRTALQPRKLSSLAQLRSTAFFLQGRAGPGERRRERGCGGGAGAGGMAPGMAPPTPFGVWRVSVGFRGTNARRGPQRVHLAKPPSPSSQGCVGSLVSAFWRCFRGVSVFSVVSVGFRGCFRARNLFPCSVVSVAHGTGGCHNQVVGCLGRDLWRAGQVDRGGGSHE